MDFVLTRRPNLVIFTRAKIERGNTNDLRTMAGGINDKNASVSLLDMQRAAHPLVGILCLVENRRRWSFADHVQVETESCGKDEDYTYGSLHVMLLSLRRL